MGVDIGALLMCLASLRHQPRSCLRRLVGWRLRQGYHIAEGLGAGITSDTSLVTNAIVALANAAVAAAKEALQIHSPSRVSVARSALMLVWIMYNKLRKL